jgi:hypothetical protein
MVHYNMFSVTVALAGPSAISGLCCESTLPEMAFNVII